MHSARFKLFIRLITLVNIISVCFQDYSARVFDGYAEKNRIFITMEIFCNVIFGIEVVFETIIQGFVLDKNSYLRSGWNVANLLTFVATYITLYYTLVGQY